MPHRPNSNQPICPSSYLLLATRRAACQLEFRRSLLLLLLIAGAAIDQVPNCLAISTANENENNNNAEAEAASPLFYDGQMADEEDKRAGGRAFLPIAAAENDKRGGARAFSVAEQKRAGGRAFQSEPQPIALNDLEKRGGAHSFFFHPDEKKKRGGARPFFGNGFFGGDGTWKRGGGRYFFRSFADNGFGNGWIKRGGGRHFSMKRGGGRSFFGGMDSLFDPSNYWASQRYAPSVKYPRRSPLESSSPEDLDDEQPISPPFYYVNNHNFEGQANGKRGGGRAFNGDNNGMMNSELWEKRGGGRMFSGGGSNQ